jgi:hypothetical protein
MRFADSPRELRAQPNRQVFMNQYEVDREEQTFISDLTL